MYDVIFIDAQGQETPVAHHLDDRDGRRRRSLAPDAAERGAGRMVMPGSSTAVNCVCVVPVPPGRIAPPTLT